MPNAVGMGDDFYIVNTGENCEQRIGGMDSGADTVEVDAGVTGDDAGLSSKSHRFDAVGQNDLVGCQVRIDLLLAENRRGLVGTRPAGVGIDVVELALQTGDFGRGARGPGPGDERTG